jgi:hypothetical protein
MGPNTCQHSADYSEDVSHQLTRLLHQFSFHAQVSPRDVRPEEEGDGMRPGA